MKEQVTKLEQPIVSGSVKIELIKDNKVTKTIEQKNAITTNTQEWGRRMYKAMFSWYNELNPTTHSYFDYRKMMRYVHLVNITYTEGDPRLDGTEPIFPCETSSIGYLDRANETNTTSVKLGLINKEESYATEDKAVFVYDWQPSKGIGTFNTIVHSADSDPNGAVIDSLWTKPVLVGGRSLLLDTDLSTYYHGFCIENDNLYLSKEGSSSERRTGVRKISLVTGVETAIEFPSSVILNIDPVYVFIKTIGVITYYYLSDGGRNRWNVVIDNNGSWSYHNTTIDGSISTDGTYIYVFNLNYPSGSRWGTRRYSMDLQTLNGGMNFTRGLIYSDGKFYDDGSNTRTVLTASAMPWDNTDAEQELHKFGKSGFSYPCIDGDKFYGSKYITWSHNNPSYNIDKYVLYKRNHTAGVFPYNGREGAIFKLDTPVTKSDVESMRITYTFNFE